MKLNFASVTMATKAGHASRKPQTGEMVSSTLPENFPLHQAPFGEKVTCTRSPGAADVTAAEALESQPIIAGPVAETEYRRDPDPGPPWEDGAWKLTRKWVCAKPAAGFTVTLTPLGAAAATPVSNPTHARDVTEATRLLPMASLYFHGR